MRKTGKGLQPGKVSPAHQRGEEDPRKSRDGRVSPQWV